MNNSLLKNIFVFPNTLIAQITYHSWRKIWIHDCQTFIKNHIQILDLFEKGFVFKFSIMKNDIRILEELQPNYPTWPKSLNQVLRSIKIINGYWNGILTIESISNPFSVEKGGFKIHPFLHLIWFIFENIGKNYGIYLFYNPKVHMQKYSPET